MIRYLDIQTLELIKSLENIDPFQVSLKLKGLTEEKRKFIASQVAARRKAKTKIPVWQQFDQIIYPGNLSIEQASSAETAKYKSGLIKGAKMADLTGGLGIDSFYFSKAFNRVNYVEINPDLYNAAIHNFNILGVKNISFYNMSAQSFLDESRDVFDLIFIDPSRRTNNKKVYKLEESEPDIIKLMPRLRARARKVIIKLSPFLDLHHIFNTLEEIEAFHVVAVNNECKEILVILDESCTDPGRIHTINLQQGESQYFRGSLTKEAEISLEYGVEGSYLYDPNAAVRKSGLFKSISLEHNLKKLASNSHLYTGNKIQKNFPGRIFKINEKLSYGDFKRTYKKSQAMVAVRNFILTVEQLRIENRISDGSNIYLFFTTDAENNKIVFVASRV